jgi:hypothetical protein
LRFFWVVLEDGPVFVPLMIFMIVRNYLLAGMLFFGLITVHVWRLDLPYHESPLSGIGIIQEDGSAAIAITDGHSCRSAEGAKTIATAT